MRGDMITLDSRSGASFSLAEQLEMAMSSMGLRACLEESHRLSLSSSSSFDAQLFLSRFSFEHGAENVRFGGVVDGGVLEKLAS